MVLLEHVDVNNLNVNSFKQVLCPCELCDDGCFDRNKQKHHPDCKRRRSAKYKNKPLRPSHSCPLSHYQATFKANPDFRPPTAIVPPLERYATQVPMDLVTVQQTEFVPLPITGRPKLCKVVEKYKPPKEPLDTTSSYQHDFVNRDGGKTQIVKKYPNETTMYIPTDKMSENTTAREHFKLWKSKPLQSFNELPSCAGSMLFPTAERHFSTTTSSFHQPMWNVPKTLPIIKCENQGAMLNAGPMYMDTQYRDTFIHHRNAEKPKLIDPTKAPKKKNNNDSIHPMESITQTRHDFINYPGHKPPSLANCDPYSSNLDMCIYPDAIHELDTIYSQEYPGYDPKMNPIPKSFKKEEGPYKPPKEKFDGETVTMRDFKPIDVSQIPKLKVIRADSSIKISKQPMETLTMNRKHFVPYNVKPVRLAGDPMPMVYVPPTEKFASTTTTRETFSPKFTERVRAFRPEIPQMYRSDEAMDLHSHYRNEYINHGLTMCESKAYMIAKALTDNKDRKTSASSDRIVLKPTSAVSISKLRLNSSKKIPA